MNENKVTYKEIGSAIGSATGLLWSYKKGKGFWAIVGFGFLGAVAGSVIGGLMDNTKPDIKVTGAGSTGGSTTGASTGSTTGTGANGTVATTPKS